ncbi:MarC family protein [Agaribacterium haliotis]|uniref:MarC family protein n=1 Tax=Agaribacterium haliotis TaxID=2013869 RepID=UPI000BB5373E|nr:MarC family protein [Agaribacterium haliotis]
MTIDIEHLITVFLGFFAIMNPIANTAVFLGLCSNQGADERRQIALRSLNICFVIVVCFALLGKLIFDLFGISLLALRLTGGILIFVVGYQMLHGTSAKMHQQQQGQEHSDIAISPLAVPILAGPGTIATAMNYSAGGWQNVLGSILAFTCLCFITYIAFINSQRIVSKLGNGGLAIVTRLMGLILAVIGMQMLIDGSDELYNMWTATTNS